MLFRSYEGQSRTEAARIGGVTLQIIRDWVLKFNAAGPEGLIDRKAPGQPSRLTAAHRAALVDAVERGPDPAVQSVVRWRVLDLVHWLWEEFTVPVSKQTLSRELRKLGYIANYRPEPSTTRWTQTQSRRLKRGVCRRTG